MHRIILSIFLAMSFIAFSQTAQAAGCSGRLTNVTAVSLDRSRAVRINVTNPSTRGRFDGPVLSAKIRPSAGCLVVHFSAHVQPVDNGMAFQASANGRLMAGHGQFRGVLMVMVPTPNRAVNPSMMVSYTFFHAVRRKGPVMITIRPANCCGNSSDGQILSATLVVQY